MKTITALTAAFLIVASTAQSDQMMDHCKQVSEYADSAMTARQNGLSLSETLGVVAELRKRYESKGEYALSMVDMLQELVIMSFDHPTFRSEGAQRQAIKEFSSNVMLDCIKEWRRSS